MRISIIAALGPPMPRLRIMLGAIATTSAVIFSVGIVAALAQDTADPFRLCLASCLVKQSGDPARDWQAHTACVQARNCFAGPPASSKAVPQKLVSSPASRSRSIRPATTAVAKNRNAEPVEKRANKCSAYSHARQAWVPADCNPGPPVSSPPPQASPSVSAEAVPVPPGPPPATGPQQPPLPALSPTSSQPPPAQPPINPEQSPHSPRER
jgi:hypothetical protein